MKCVGNPRDTVNDNRINDDESLHKRDVFCVIDMSSTSWNILEDFRAYNTLAVR